MSQSSHLFHHHHRRTPSNNSRISVNIPSPQPTPTTPPPAVDIIAPTPVTSRPATLPNLDPDLRPRSHKHEHEHGRTSEHLRAKLHRRHSSSSSTNSHSEEVEEGGSESDVSEAAEKRKEQQSQLREQQGRSETGDDARKIEDLIKSQQVLKEEEGYKRRSGESDRSKDKEKDPKEAGEDIELGNISSSGRTESQTQRNHLTTQTSHPSRHSHHSRPASPLKSSDYVNRRGNLGCGATHDAPGHSSDAKCHSNGCPWFLVHDLIGASLAPIGKDGRPTDREKFMSAFLPDARWSILLPHEGGYRVTTRHYNLDEVFDKFWYPLVSFQWSIDSDLSLLLSPPSSATSTNSPSSTNHPTPPSPVPPILQSLKSQISSNTNNTGTIGGSTITQGGGNERDGEKGSAGGGAEKGGGGGEQEVSTVVIQTSFQAFVNTTIDPDAHPLVGVGTIIDTLLITSGVPQILFRSFAVEKAIRPAYMRPSLRCRNKYTLGRERVEDQIPRFFRGFLRSVWGVWFIRQFNKFVTPLIALSALAGSIQNIGIDGNAGMFLAALGVFSSAIAVFSCLGDLTVDYLEGLDRRKRLKLLQAAD